MGVACLELGNRLDTFPPKHYMSCEALKVKNVPEGNNKSEKEFVSNLGLVTGSLGTV